VLSEALISSDSVSLDLSEGSVSSDSGSSSDLTSEGECSSSGDSEGSGSSVHGEVGSPSLVSEGELGNERSSSLLLS